MLEALGLTEEEARTYAALVRSGACPKEQLATLTGLSSGAVGRALDGLTSHGLVSRDEPDGRRVAAQPPDTAGEVLLLHRMQELMTARAAMMRLADEYHASTREQRGQLPVEYTPKAAVPQRVEQIQRGARREVLHFDTPPYSSVDNRIQVEQLAAGVSYRTVYDRHAIDYPGAMERIDQCIEAGEQARVIARIPMKVMIVDRELAILPALGGIGTWPGATVIVQPSPLLDALIELFERVWVDSVPLDLGAGIEGVRPAELDKADVRLLTLLLSGLTDEAVARHLGVGRRTVLRRARSLMDRAGVATRMQLGWYAARRGWIGLSRKRLAVDSSSEGQLGADTVVRGVGDV
ncbi:hypothetical protein AQ490_15275 [Wenjunlia vitaminophila]|uniref:Sugar-specific transcriptional regulator TrmB n=1 Tax=Wenjunlia vitaminophila TaxID=76728 RepID=A0A0T6LWE8_WENVI|nr:helix-turn-helix domain-containing protein [Wenjunlia vitaminophila]KRV50446.1 hypothetical protein AQ490_15275 [Wenjunlia vitaminophila]